MQIGPVLVFVYTNTYPALDFYFAFVFFVVFCSFFVEIRVFCSFLLTVSQAVAVCPLRASLFVRQKAHPARRCILQVFPNLSEFGRIQLRFGRNWQFLGKVWKFSGRKWR